MTIVIRLGAGFGPCPGAKRIGLLPPPGDFRFDRFGVVVFSSMG